MLVQHLLTERIFRKVFQNPDFVNRNIIAHEIDKVITSLTSRKFNRNDFLKPLDRFYTVLEKRATEIDDYSIKQTFLNTVYEKFFQGFAIKVADTHGIVYTPQPIVDFMVSSVDEILKREFGLSLSSKGVHILDPFAGTNNFSMNILRRINKTDLKHKYLNEIHANEIMLLPYYIACMNIEHQYYELTGEYIPFPGMCLVDTFQLAEDAQPSLFSEENTQRVEQLKRTPIFVFIGNPPYNAGQANENDNNKNRKYPILDKRISDTFAKDSKATNKNMLQDPYVKAFRFAMDKVLERGEGIVAYVTNNSFVDSIAFDGMRKHIESNFNQVFIINLKGNVRQNPKISGTTHNVFGIQVGVSIVFMIKKKED
jgi:predicted helicase